MFSCSCSYIISEPSSLTGVKICLITLAERSYPRRLAFNFLDALQREFLQLHGRQIDLVERPYQFMTFGDDLLSFKSIPASSPLILDLSNRKIHPEDKENVYGYAREQKSTQNGVGRPARRPRHHDKEHSGDFRPRRKARK